MRREGHPEGGTVADRVPGAAGRPVVHPPHHGRPDRRATDRRTRAERADAGAARPTRVAPRQTSAAARHPKVLLTGARGLREAGDVKHRMALIGALALGVMISLLLVGRARAAEPPARWTPDPGETLQYQLSGTIDRSVDATVFDVDLFEVSRATIAALQARGAHVLCYLNAGTWEPYRPDSARFPASVKGRRVDGWEDERWLDIRRLDVLKPIMAARLDRCAAKGFDGVEYDWIDGYAQDTGFPLTRAAQLRYDRWLARAAQARGLAVAQKNGPGLVRALVDTWDLAVVEECFQYRECWRYQAYLDRGKPVLVVEYRLARDRFCDRATAMGIHAIRKHLRLDAWRASC